MKTMTRTKESTASTVTSSINLLLAFELGERVWKLGCTTGDGPAAARPSGGGGRHGSGARRDCAGETSIEAGA